MAVLLTSARDVACDAIVDLLDNGGAGQLELISSAGPTTLAVLPLSNPAFGASSTGVATANAITDETSAVNTGTTDAYYLKAGTGDVVLSGDVGTGSQDIVLNTTSITIGDSISITSLTITVPAGTP